MQEKWVVSAKKADFNKIAQTFGITPVTARIIRNRDVIGEDAIREYLMGTTADLHDPSLMKDLPKAASILMDRVKAGAKIRVVGDYDIDGVCSTYILLKGIGRIGGIVDYQIPERIRDGYGINMSIIEKALSDGVDTIITCDNGIAAIDEINYAKAQGMTVIVTDHHEIPYEDDEQGVRRYKTGDADAIINPHQVDCGYPFQMVCGAVVAYKLIQYLWEEAGVSPACDAAAAARRKEETRHPGYLAAQQAFLPFAAFATIGDIMPLQGENRIIVKEGLTMFAQFPNYGLKALMEVCQVIPEDISAYHIGFILGPCINAGGRLETAKESLELFLAEDERTAMNRAIRLKSLNDERKDMTALGTAQAIDMIENSDLKKDHVLVVPLYDCHESIAGIIAGRLKEHYNRPVFVLTRAENGVKGSGRSIEAFSMYEEMVKSSCYLDKFGGHPMAAGLSLKEENVEPFRRSMNEKETLTEEDLMPKIVIDVPMPIDYVSEQQISDLKLLEPFGRGNEKPLFAQKDLRVAGARILGKNRNVVKFVVESPLGGCRMEAMYFGDVEEIDGYIREKFGNDEAEKMYLGRDNKVRLSVVYYPDVNEFRGIRTLQIVIRNYQ